MKIRILGCHGSDGMLDTPEGRRTCNTCGFLLNDSLLLDAGTVASALPISDQRKIRYIILSHLHFDHIKGLPTLADNLSDQAGTPIMVAGLPEVIDGLHRHIFNTDVYPDFFTIPTSQNPILASQHLKPGTSYTLAGVNVTPILVNHTVPTSGFIIQNQNSAFVYSGDTDATDELWHEARRLPHLKAAFIECSYPNSMKELARTSKHLTPASLAQEFKKLDRPDVALYVYHLKPVFKEMILQELRSLHLPRLRVLEEGETLTI